MEWLIVVSLIVFGLILLVAEIIFVPGTTVVGVFGFAFMIVGIGLSFRYFGTTGGWSTFGGAAVLSAVVIFYSFKANVWERFALKASNKSKVNEDELNVLSLGQEGVTLSALRPIGKAEVAGKTYEAKTMGGYLNTGTRIRIIQILSNQILVEPIS